MARQVMYRECSDAGRRHRVGDEDGPDVGLFARYPDDDGVGRRVIGTQVFCLALTLDDFAQGDVPLADAQRARLQRVLIVERLGGGDDVARDFQHGALGRRVGEDQHLLGELSRAARRIVGDAHSRGVARLDGRLGIGHGSAAAAGLCLDDEQWLGTRVQHAHVASDLAVLLHEHAQVMLPLQPGGFGLGRCGHGHDGQQCYGQRLSHLFLGNDGALDAQGGGAFLAVGLDLDGLLEGAGTPDGAVGNLDLPLLARFDGFGGVFGAGTGVGEFKGARHGAFSLLDGAEVMTLDLERCPCKTVVGHCADGHQAHRE